MLTGVEAYASLFCFNMIVNGGSVSSVYGDCFRAEKPVSLSFSFFFAMFNYNFKKSSAMIEAWKVEERIKNAAEVMQSEVHTLVEPLL